MLIDKQREARSLATAARDTLATVDYLLGQIPRRDGHLDAAHIAMLRESADGLRQSFRVYDEMTIALTDGSR